MLPASCVSHLRSTSLMMCCKDIARNKNINGNNNNSSEDLSAPCHFGKYQLLYDVANYVFPKYWTMWRRKVQDDRQLRVTFGVHPHLPGHVNNDMLGELHKLVSLEFEQK